jgi:hypothetical protein
MLRGLAVMLTDVALPAVSAPRAPVSDIGSVDPDVLRLVANMVLQLQSQVNHAY